MALVYYGSPVVLGDFEIISIEAVRGLDFGGMGAGVMVEMINKLLYTRANKIFSV